MVSAKLKNFCGSLFKRLELLPLQFKYVFIIKLYCKQPGKFLNQLSCTTIITRNNYSPYRLFANLL